MSDTPEHHTKLSVGEAAAAIAEGVYGESERYQAFYKAIGEKVNGFPGIWTLIAECAIEIERLADADDDFWVNKDLITLSDVVSARLVKQTEVPDYPSFIRECVDTAENK